MEELSRQYGTEKRQQELLDILKDVDVIFRQNHIVYSLSGGSLIGALRHQGFIPWDDDVDIMLDRADFDRACALMSEDRPDCVYGLRREHWVYRIHRKDSRDPDDAAIDLFAVDHCPDSALMRKLKVFLIKTLQGMLKPVVREEGKSFLYRLCLRVTHIMGLPFSSETKFRWYDAVSRIGNKKPTQYVGIYDDPFKNLHLRYVSTLMDRVEPHVFEDTELPITAEYDNYLTTQFGDYMTPPPEAERVSPHNI